MHTAPPPRHPPQRPAPAAAVAEAPAPVRNTARNLLIGVTVVLFAVAGVLLVVLLGDLGGGGAELDVTAAQRGVRAVLLDPINGYGRDDVSAVRCNDGRNPVVRSGSGFTCTVTVDGAVRRVAVVFTDDAGTYEVDRPR
ncbi:DUF4333 domain-containing protein [Mycobacterium sp. M1]|uniref:DUF4333 domain-containing protein n=2 Tax=Mycolicibacter acidiphilus TaxID=2835306 RepID=A0ABS5RQG5_9MYCO|nr:DUF4333 domain-containing protein [Mycolicibacter acidiphilus]